MFLSRYGCYITLAGYGQDKPSPATVISKLTQVNTLPGSQENPHKYGLVKTLDNFSIE